MSEWEHPTPADKRVIKKRAVIATVVVIVIVIISVASYLAPQPSPQGTAPPAGGPTQSSATTLQDNMKAALAENKNVATEKISIHFYSPTEDNEIVAVGATVENGESYLFFYDSTNQMVTRMDVDYQVENSEIATVWGICAQKDSEWTGNKLVPWGFSKVENINAYDFLYCDQYIPEWSKWSTGMATIYLDNQEIEWGPTF